MSTVDSWQEIHRLVQRGELIEAIKLARSRYGLSLLEAKDLCERLRAGEPGVVEPPLPAAAGAGGPGGPRSFPARPPVSGRRPGAFRNRWLLLVPAAGIILLLIAGGLVWRTMAFRKTAVPVEGIVVENLRSRRTFTPVFEFPWNGEIRRVESTTSGAVNRRPVYPTGETVRLLVDPATPDRVRVDSWFGNWFVPTLLGGIGGAALVLGSTVAWILRRF